MGTYGNYISVTHVSLPFRRQQNQPKHGVEFGFSLVELLTVICMIGILCSLALGWYGGDNRAAIERVTNQRNAQEIVSLGICATLSGADFVVAGDKKATVLNLTSGVTGQQGPWKGQLFRLSNLTPNELPGALSFVNFDSDLLLYDPAGTQP